VGGIVVADVVRPSGPGATAEAAEILNNAAAATIQTSDPVVGPGQYLKIDTTTSSTSGRRAPGSPLKAEAFVTIADGLRTGVVPADLRAALYKAAALIPGVTVGDRQATVDGRTGSPLASPLPTEW
jgi:hypothetical protein